MPDPNRSTATFRSTVEQTLDAGPAPPTARELWRRLGQAGVLTALYPTGAADGPDPRRLDALLTTLDARYPMGPVLSVCVQVATVVPLLVREAPGNGPVAEVAAAMLRGERTVALAVTDAGAAGSDLLDASTTVHIGPDELVVDGGKEWITNADGCDHALVLARHRKARHFTSFSWVLVPTGAPGVGASPATSALFTGSGVGHLRFTGVRLDPAYLVGRPGRALAGFARQVGTERLAGALWARALCRRVLVDTRHWLARRTCGDATLWDNPAVRARFARCLVELAGLDALSDRHAAGTGEPDSPTRTGSGMVLKAAVGASVDRILGECADLRGADAFRDGGEAGLRAEAAMFGIAGGAGAAMLAGIADHADELLEVS